MRVLIISDIHANLSALESVLEDAGEFDMLWCLGDLVGYGPDPNECVNLVRGLPNAVCILGNHDAAILGQIASESFNPEAREALDWTRNALTESSTEFLKSLPESLESFRLIEQEHAAVTLAHGSPRQPIWEYLLDSYSATSNFDFFRTPYCFVGHTHIPVIYQLVDGKDTATLIIPEANTEFNMTPRAIMNPGSVGQPRDRDPRAAYAIFHVEDELWEFRRVRYDVKSAQQRMKKIGLPDRHILRLSAGW